LFYFVIGYVGNSQVSENAKYIKIATSHVVTKFTQFTSHGCSDISHATKLTHALKYATLTLHMIHQSCRKKEPL